jgi:hypothetical protein
MKWIALYREQRMVERRRAAEFFLSMKGQISLVWLRPMPFSLFATALQYTEAKSKVPDWGIKSTLA